MARGGHLPAAPAGAVRLSVGPVENLTLAVRFLEGLAAEGGRSRSESDAIDSTRWELRLPVATLLAGDALQQLIDLPIRFRLVLDLGPEEIRIAGEPRGLPTLESGDRLYEVVEDVEEFERARERQEPRRVLKWFEDRELEAELEVVNDPEETKVRWIRSGESLCERLRESWLATLESVFSRGLAETLVVGDAGADGLLAQDLCVCGPEAAESAPTTRELTTFRCSRHWWDQHRRSDLPLRLPVPGALVPSPRGSGTLAAVDPLLRGVAAALVWLWLAKEVDSSQALPRVSFEGQRLASFELPVVSTDRVADELTLWEWAMEEQDPARYYAVQKAVALAVFSEADLPRAARPALGSARTLLNALRKDQMAEAMATRRSVRDAAVGAGRAAAEAGRTAGAKSLERVIVQAAATAGILIAKSGEALSAAAATRLLVLVGGLLAASAVLAAAEYLGAYGLLSSFKEDLSLYEDTLSQDDIRGIERMKSLRKARCAITVSLAITIAILVAALAALVIAIANT